MLRKLIELLPVSRREYTKALAEIGKIIGGLVEAEANHCQIEMSIIQQLQKDRMVKPSTKKSTTNGKDPAFQ